MRLTRTVTFIAAILSAIFVLPACSTNPGTSLTRTSSVDPALRTGGRSELPSAPREILYAANYDSNSVTEYGAYANGDVVPLRVIAGPHTIMDRPTSIAVGPDGDLYVDDFSYTTPHVSVFAATASGDAIPLRTITANSQGGIHSFGITVDAQGYLYEADTDNRDIRVFAPEATGDAAPVRIVSDKRIASPWGVFVGSARHLWVTDSFLGAIYEFPAGANGSVHAPRRIGGPATGLRTPVAIVVDPSGFIDVVDVNAGNVKSFFPHASGDVPPARQFAPPGPIQPAYGIAYLAGQLYVSMDHGQPDEYHVDVFASTSNGVVQPLRSIAGPRTMLGATAIAVH
jgi:hypothetical protein